jgi:tetratricopeptide (TPR) repeat protein
MLTYLANARLGDHAVGYHVVNVALHALVTVEALYLGSILLGSAVGGAVTAALFAVHPIHTEAVTSIVGRAELLAALLVLASCLALVRATQREGWVRAAWVGISVGVLAMGTLAKESALAGVPLCAIIHLWVRRQPGIRRTAVLLAPYGLVGLGYLALRFLMVGALTYPEKPAILSNPLAHVAVLPRVATAVVVLWQYLSQLALPLRLSADYSFNEIPIVLSVFDPRFLIAAALFGCLGLALVLGVKQAPELAVAVALMVVSLALTANVLFPIGTIKAERLLYLPSFGWCLACGWFVWQWSRRGQRTWLLVVAVVVTAFAARTAVRNRDWRDNFTLFAATVQTSPNSAQAHHNLAVTYDERGQLDEAMLHFRRALAIDPTFALAAFGIGRIYEEKGLYAGALHWYGQATQLDPRLSRAHLNAGAIRYRLGELAPAATAFSAGLESDPDNPALLVGLSLVRLAQGDRAEAEAIIKRVESLPHGDPHAAELLGEARQALHEANSR